MRRLFVFPSAAPGVIRVIKKSREAVDKVIIEHVGDKDNPADVAAAEEHERQIEAELVAKAEEAIEEAVEVVIVPEENEPKLADDSAN